MVEIGQHDTIEARRMEETRACGHHWYFDPYGPWIKKSATKAQLQSWPELAAFKVSTVATYILWRKHK
jgi:hypothetical protein